MSSFFPDLNVWLALSDGANSHSPKAWSWLDSLTGSDRLLFSRITQVGLLRLLTNQAAMGSATLTLGQAWGVYDTWLADPRVQFQPEPRGLDGAFRQITQPLRSSPASKAVADCLFAAFARESGATLVTFDRTLYQRAKSAGCRAALPGRSS